MKKIYQNLTSIRYMIPDRNILNTVYKMCKYPKGKVEQKQENLKNY